MCLVACMVERFEREDESPAEAYVLTDAAQADRLVDFFGKPYPATILFFRMLRTAVLHPAVCPEGLTEESWS